VSCNATYNICAIRGDTFVKTIALSQRMAGSSDTNPVDLTGVSVALHVGSARNFNPLFIYDSEPEISIPDPLTGTIKIRVEGAETRNWPSRAAVYDLRLTWPDGTITTVLTGSLSTEPTVGP